MKIRSKGRVCLHTRVHCFAGEQLQLLLVDVQILLVARQAGSEVALEATKAATARMKGWHR